MTKKHNYLVCDPGELQTCWCGSTEMSQIEKRYFNNTSKWYIYCEDCSEEASSKLSPQRAVDFWNTMQQEEKRQYPNPNKQE